MTILLLSNPTKKECADFSDSLKLDLQGIGYTVHTHPDQCNDVPGLIVIVGGDGTVLRFVETIVNFDVPVLGINFGHRGYLTSCEPSVAVEKIEEIARGDCTFESRMLYDGEISDKDGKIKKKFFGLNEAVLSRGGLSRAVDFSLYINNSHVISFPADGVIIATPTGSTAYNFSASGPILMPEAENLVITPICASALLRTSIVTSASDVIELTMDGERLCGSTETPILVVDGYKRYTIDFEDKISIKRSEKRIKIYGGEKGDFLRILQEKMK